MYLKTPLAPPIKNLYEVNYHNKYNKSLTSPDRIASKFLEKTLPLFCFPEKGFVMTRQDLSALAASNRFPSVLVAESEFNRFDTSYKLNYLVVPIVLGSDISPFSEFFLKHDNVKYDLKLEFTQEQAQFVYGVDLENLYDAETVPGTTEHNTGILYLAHVFKQGDRGESPVGYNQDGSTELWVKLGNKGENVQEQLLGPALRYVSTETKDVNNYAKVSILDDSNNILGFKTVDLWTSGKANMFLRVSFTMPLAEDIEIDLNAIPVALKDFELSDNFIEKLGITLNKNDQFSVTPSDSGDFGGSGTYTIPRGSREFKIPIELDSGSFAKACMYNVDFGDTDLVVVNNDILILARAFDYTAKKYDDYGYHATYKLKSLDGAVEYASGVFYGNLDFSSEIRGPYLLEVELVNMEVADYTLRAQRGLSTAPAKRDTFFGCLNWCSHDLLNGSMLHAIPYSSRTTTLSYRVDVGSGSFEFVSIIPFLNGTQPVRNNVEIVL